MKMHEIQGLHVLLMGLKNLMLSEKNQDLGYEQYHVYYTGRRERQDNILFMDQYLCSCIKHAHG